jgi:hypothetical protein
MKVYGVYFSYRRFIEMLNLQFLVQLDSITRTVFTVKNAKIQEES